MLDKRETTSDRRSVRWPILIALAVMMMLSPHVARLVSPPAGRILNESRTLEPWPALPNSLSEWRALARKFEAAAQDQFAWRATLIALASDIRYALGYANLETVAVGKDGWLFYNHKSVVSYHTGRRQPWTATRIEGWLDVFEKRVRQLEARDAEFVMLVAPRKPTIYPEQAPFPTVVRNEVDVLMEAARARRIDRILYPKDTLLKAKTDHPLFGPYDTHWNAHGAYLAYAAVMERLSRSDPSLAPLPLSAFAMDTQGRNSNDLAAMLGIVGRVDQHGSQFVHEYRIKFEYLEERQGLESPAIIETNSESQKTLLLVRDSFSETLLPLLERHFRRIILAHYANGDFRHDLIERYSPDVIMLEMIESSARYAMRDAVQVSAEAADR